MDISTLSIALLVALAIAGVGYALIYPLLSGEARAEKRVQSIAKSTKAAAKGPQRSRRDQVSQALEQLDQRTKGQQKLTLQMRIDQAGVNWSKQTYAMVCVICALGLGVVMYLVSKSLLLMLAGMFIGAVGLPLWILGFKRKRRLEAFMNEFPNAVDVIVRGLRAGLPLNDCVRIIGQEAAEPVRTEFRTAQESMAVGIALPEAMGELYTRVPVSEVSFFAIVLQIQAKSGGNLSEALGNLSKVIRERRKMKMKIQAVSMEAKASAMIIGALPPCVAIMVFLTSPKYIEQLWTTQAGQVAIFGCAMWMTVGILIMKKMINFDF
jgi:tight adherence protein B